MIYLATDHRGFELKEKIKKWLFEWGFEFEDMGAFELNPEDDYPDFVHKAAEKGSQDPDNSRAIILGGSGQGEAMVANRYKGVRAAVFYGPPFKLLFTIGGFFAEWNWRGVYSKIIKLSRGHNNANILSLGAFFTEEKSLKKIIKLWLDTPFSNEERHKRRIEKIENF